MSATGPGKAFCAASSFLPSAACSSRMPRAARPISCAIRLKRLRADPARDARLAAEVAALEQPYRRHLNARRGPGAPAPELEQFGWLLEELRVSLFAQQLRTPVPVSPKRLARLWDTLRR